MELDQGRFFENKIVLIGGTALRLQDFHPTPFSESLRYPSTMAGVEIQATAIATLAQDNFLYPLIPRRDLQAVLVLALVAALSSGLGTLSQARSRLLLTIGNGGLWLLLGYGLQTSGQWLIPVAVPVAGLLTIGGGCVVLAILRDYYRHQRLETAIRENDDLPSVEELLSFVKPTAAELQAQTQLVAGKMIGQRYEVVQVLGMGGFSETFTAQDKQRPGQPICVVKQLKTHNQDPTVVHLVRRSFKIEAEMLERLGSHSQIPRLLAYFEEGEEFFLIQEYVEGISLLSEFVTQRYFTPATVMTMLADLLPVLAFVHAQQVIHRDIKPSNIIRNTTNGRLYLIDFGIAKAMTAQLLAARQDNPITVGLGTQGYMPREQAAGHPVFSSDLYALGVMAIQALTGFNPQQLGRDHQGELDWQDADLGLSAEFEHWLTQMVHQDYDQRFASAQVALDHLIQVPEFNSVAAETRSAIARQGVVEYSLANLPTPHEAISVDWNETARDEEGATQPWPQDWQDPATLADRQTQPWPQDWQDPASASDPSPASPSPEDTRPWPQDWQDPVTQLDRSNPAPQANPAAGDDALEPPTIVEASPPVIEIEPPTLSASRPIPEEDGPS